MLSTIRLLFKKNRYKLIMADLVLILLAILLLLMTKKPEYATGLAVTDSDYSSATVTWEAADNADGYRVYRSKDGGRFEYLLSTTDTHYKDTDLRTGSNYRYAIVSRNGLRVNRINQEYLAEVTPELETPKIEADLSKGTIDLKISEVAGAVGYEIFRDGEKIGDVDTNFFSDASAEDDKRHTYEVKAYIYKDNPVYSKSSNNIEAVLHMLKNFKVETVDEGLLIEWDESEHYDTYKVYDGDALLADGSDTTLRLSKFELAHAYDVKVIGHSSEDDSQSPALERKFEVVEEPMNNEEARQAACDWAIDIAEDNSFTYGTGNRAHRYGCYFCGTNTGPNLNKKGSSLVNGHSYEKTYCCNPFVHAAYSHGAGDPNMLRACQSGGGVAMSEKSYTKYGNWKKVGKPAQSSLQMGDVLVRSGHVMLYVGNGKIAHAGGEGWDDRSIRVNNLATGSYGRVQFVMRYTGTGRGVKYGIKYLDESGDA